MNAKEFNSELADVLKFGLQQVKMHQALFAAVSGQKSQGEVNGAVEEGEQREEDKI